MEDSLVTITESEFKYLVLCEEFLQLAFDMIPCLDEKWEEWYAKHKEEE